MATWKWEGLNREGKTLYGEEEVKSEKELRKILRNKGIRPTKIREPSLFDIDLGELLLEHGLVSPFSRNDLLRFSKQFSVLVSAGIPILQGLEILYKQEKNPSLRSALKNITQNVGGGKSIAESMMMEKGFDKLYCNLIKAGELSGSLDTIVNKLVLYMEQNEKIRQQVKSAMTYPAIVVVIGIVVVGLMLIFVVPQFLDMLKDTGQEVPAITQFVIDSSLFLQNYILFLIVGSIAGFFVFRYFIGTKDGKPVWDGFVMKVPLFGDISIKGNLASFCRTMSTMLASGIALVDALEICVRVVDSSVIARDIHKVKKQVEEGKTIATPLSKIDYFPDMVAQMIKVGEQTGGLDIMFEKIAIVFEREVEVTIQRVTKLIEPLILVVLGGIVALILVAMYMPIFMSAGGASGT